MLDFSLLKMKWKHNPTWLQLTSILSRQCWYGIFFSAESHCFEGEMPRQDGAEKKNDREEERRERAELRQENWNFSRKVQDRSGMTGIRVILLSPSTPIHPLRWCMKIHLCYKPGAKTTWGGKGREKDTKRTEWRINGFTLAVSSQNQTGEEEEFDISARRIWKSQRPSHLLLNYKLIINTKESLLQSIKLTSEKCRLKQRLLFAFVSLFYLYLSWTRSCW